MSAYKYKDRMLDYIMKLLMLTDVYSQVRETFVVAIIAKHKDGDYKQLFEREEGKDIIEVNQDDWRFKRLQAFYVLICLTLFNSSIGDDTDMQLKHDILDDE